MRRAPTLEEIEEILEDFYGDLVEAPGEHFDDQ
jgi:hypothetical protein